MVNFIAPMCYNLDDDSSDVEDDNKSYDFSDDIKSFNVDDEPSSVVVTLVSPRRPAVAKLSRPRAAAPSPSDIYASTICTSEQYKVLGAPAPDSLALHFNLMNHKVTQEHFNFASKFLLFGPREKFGLINEVREG